MTETLTRRLENRVTDYRIARRRGGAADELLAIADALTGDDELPELLRTLGIVQTMLDGAHGVRSVRARQSIRAAIDRDAA